MKIYLHSIVSEGLKLDFKDENLTKLIMEIFVKENPQSSSLEGNIFFQKFDQHIRLQGRLSVDLKPACDSCLNQFTYKFKDNFEINFSPLYRSKRDESRNADQAEEIELQADDLDFVAYEGDHIDVEPILCDQLVLNLPSSFRCKTNCKGLCQSCGGNLNLDACECQSLDKIDPRWHALANLKPKK